MQSGGSPDHRSHVSRASMPAEWPAAFGPIALADAPVRQRQCLRALDEPWYHQTGGVGMALGKDRDGERGRSPEPRRHPRAVVGLKVVHTVVFLGELAAIAWLVVSGLLGRRDRTVAFAASAVAIEAAVYLANDRVCPLTPLTERLGASRGGVSDIFLPARVARTIPIWSTALVLWAVVLHVGAMSRTARRLRP
jgi:hypothetical protein